MGLALGVIIAMALFVMFIVPISLAILACVMIVKTGSVGIFLLIFFGVIIALPDPSTGKRAKMPVFDMF
jgi:hypothetical protein